VIRFIAILGLLAAVLVRPWAQDLVPQAASAVLIDQLTGRVLFEKAPDQSIPPASLTKLVTLHLVWKALAEGRAQASDLVEVTAETTGASVPPGSSLMFLAPGQRVTVRELMLGLAVDSGNDAGMTLARHLAGSQEAFVGAMNAEMHALGLGHTVFFDAFGYDARNRTTAADFARFCRIYLTEHPQATEVLHGVREMTYPLDANQAPGRRAPAIRQANRNSLLDAYPGADGLKTGYIEESGYNLAATAQRDGRRLIAVVLGVQGRTSAEGSHKRTEAAATLLDFGFRSYPLRPLPLPEPVAVRVWFSAPGWVTPVTAGPTVYPLSDAEAQGIRVTREGPTEVRGPWEGRAELGALVWSKDGREFYRVPLVAGPSPEAPWWQAFWDQVVLFFRGLTGAPPPASPRTGW